VVAERVLVDEAEGEGLKELGDDDHHVDDAHVDAPALLGRLKPIMQACATVCPWHSGIWLIGD